MSAVDEQDELQNYSKVLEIHGHPQTYRVPTGGFGQGAVSQPEAQLMT